MGFQLEADLRSSNEESGFRAEELRKLDEEFLLVWAVGCVCIFVVAAVSVAFDFCPPTPLYVKVAVVGLLYFSGVAYRCCRRGWRWMRAALRTNRG